MVQSEQSYSNIVQNNSVDSQSLNIGFEKELDLNQIHLQPDCSLCSIEQKRATLVKSSRCWKEQPAVGGAVGIEALVGRIAL